MAPNGSFSGFSPEAEDFFRALAQNNNKPWFEERRRQYEALILTPAKAFVAEMGQLLAEMVPGVHAVPQVNKSIFKIFRDTRFSGDKSPFKDHLGLWFWEGDGPRMECSGFYLHFEPGRLMVGAGLYMFAKHQLDAYRQAVVHPQRGAALAEAIKAVEARGCQVDGQRQKRPPRGFAADHPRADLLLYKGLYAGVDGPMPAEAHSERLLDYCLERWSAMLPLHQWLAELARGAAAMA